MTALPLCFLNQLRKFPFHSFLITSTLVVFIYVHNIEQLAINSILRSLLIGSLFSVALYFTCVRFFKTNLRAGLFTSFLLIGFCSFGTVYQYIEHLFYTGKWMFGNFFRYLILLYVIYFISLFVFILKKKSDFLQINLFLNIVVVFILLLNIGKILFFEVGSMSVKSEHKFSPYFYSIPDSSNCQPRFPLNEMPDVYYIILDGYANQQILKNNFDFSNEDFCSFLKSLGFFTASDSKANYPTTKRSLSSSLNINYLDTLTNGHADQFPIDLISKNFVSYFFKKNGYNCIHFQSGFNLTNDIYFSSDVVKMPGPNEFEKIVLSYTVFRLDELAGLTNYFQLKHLFRSLQSVIHKKSPKFVFIHIPCPHPPFVFTKTGVYTLPSKTNSHWGSREHYTGQLIYTNSILKEFIPEIIKASKIPPIILLQSDHGPWMNDTNPDSVYHARTRIFNSMLVPDEIKKLVNDSVSPVNSFRLVFNHLFNAGLPLLEDKSLDKKSFFSSTTH